MTSRNARVSVIVPAHNAEKHIRQCVDSIRAQTHENLEIIVVDDASSDGTGDSLRGLAAEDARVNLVRSAHNLGVHGARRVGLGAASGELIGFVDSDDYIEAGMYSTLHGSLAESGASIAICGASCVVGGRATGTKVAFRSANLIEGDVLGRFCRLKLGSGVLWNKLYVREVIEPSVMKELERAVDASEDYIVNFGAFARASSVATCPARLYNYVLHPGNASAQRDPWATFARLFRAYVVCLEVYALEDRSYAPLIDQLYLKQLHFPAYRISEGRPAEAVRQHLAESLRRLAESSPESIYAIIHSLPKWESRMHQTIERLKRA